LFNFPFKDNHSTFTLILGFSALLLAFTYVVLQSFNSLSHLSQNLAQETNKNDIQMSSAMEMRVSVRERAILLWHMTLIEDAFDRDELFEAFYEYGSRYQRARLQYLDTVLSDRELSLIEALDRETGNRAPLLRKFAGILMSDEKRSRYSGLLDQTLTDQVMVANILDEIITLQQKQNQVARDTASETTAGLLYELIVAVAILLLIGLGFARSVIQSFRQQNSKLASANSELAHLANYDFLTRLPNRRFLLEHLEMNLSLAKRHNKTGALFYIDLDSFKPVNDNYGHDVGDEFLQTLSNEMKTVLRESDVLARIGGDEFIAVLFDLPDREQALVVADKLLAILSSEYVLSGHHVRASASIGISYFPEPGADVDELIRRADDAMYKAKEQGKNQYQVD
jgi:diguanylate cyclase (GGDEF)-like protein